MREDVLRSNLDEEASVLEILRALKRLEPDTDPQQLKAWLVERLQEWAERDEIGFYIDEFGARDVVDAERDEGLALLAEEAVWSEHSDVMLHVYAADALDCIRRRPGVLWNPSITSCAGIVTAVASTAMKSVSAPMCGMNWKRWWPRPSAMRRASSPICRRG